MTRRPDASSTSVFEVSASILFSMAMIFAALDEDVGDGRLVNVAVVIVDLAAFDQQHISPRHRFVSPQRGYRAASGCTTAPPPNSLR